MGGGNVQAVVAGRSEHGVPPDRLGKIMPKAGFSSRRVRKAKVARCDSEMSQGAM